MWRGGGAEGGRKWAAPAEGADLDRNLAEELGVEPGTLALGWLLSRPAVTAPIIGPRTRDQLDSALSAVELSLSPEHLRRLDEIFPGRKTAPEDYAW